LIVTGRPDLRETAIEVSNHYFELGFTLLALDVNFGVTCL
jgi:hypothetical protein